MSNQPNRLGTDSRHLFHGSAIDRAKPLRFSLNGRIIDGFEGDSVLSAALASGMESAGTHHGHALALDERFAPVVAQIGPGQDASLALPMDRMPAYHGLELVAPGGNGAGGSLLKRLGGLFRGPSRTLGLRFDGAPAIAGPWVDQRPHLMLGADLLVVGGGVAGLSAAWTAALSGERVILLERRPVLGGDAPYFGAFGDEEAPDHVVARLRDNLSRSSNVTVFTRTEAFSVIEDGILAHRVDVEDDVVVGRVLHIVSARVVLATGALERLPVFAGNRVPGIASTVAAFHRASQYGVWHGRKVAISTSSSAAYRLAMKASDAGVKIARIADTRQHPQSRFIEFSKAYGITMAPGTFVREARPAHKQLAGLSVQFDMAMEGFSREIEPIWVDQLLVCGGWQPDLTLWHMAGGASRWVAAAGQLQARGKIGGVELAGAAAGYHNTGACVQSGHAAAARLFGRPAPDAIDPSVEAIYETPDGQTPISPADPMAESPTYLDGGRGLVTRPAPETSRNWLPFGREAGKTAHSLIQRPHALGVCEVAAGVQLGYVPERAAGIVARERGVVGGDLVGARAGFAVAADPLVADIPRYLKGRFGAHPRLWLVTAEDDRHFDAGCLIYVNSDSSDPRHAVGVMIGRSIGKPGSLALIGKTPLATGDRLVVKDISGATPVKLGELIEPEADDLPEHSLAEPSTV